MLFPSASLVIRRLRIILVGLLPLLVGGCHYPTLEQPQVNGLDVDGELMAQVDEFVLATMKQYQLPGIAVGIARKDSVLYARGYGWADLQNLRPISERSLFHTASVSKLFTAQAIMQLVADEKLDLDDRVVDLAPDLKSPDPAFSEVTVRQLLNHTAGLPDINNYRWHRYHTDDNSLEKYLLAQDWKLDNPPGTAFAYSNLGYDLLGYLVAKASQRPFEEYVKEKVLVPAGMHTSGFRHYLLPDSLRVQPHTKSWLTKGIRASSVYPYTREHAPSSTLNASALELTMWMARVLDGIEGEVGDVIWHQMIQPSTPISDAIGLGFQRYTIDDAQAVGHFGGDKGFRSFLVLVPERDIGVVVLGNCDYSEDFRQEIARGILKLFR